MKLYYRLNLLREECHFDNLCARPKNVKSLSRWIIKAFPSRVFYCAKKNVLDIKSHFRFRNQNNFNKSRFCKRDKISFRPETGKHFRTSRRPKKISFLLSFSVRSGLIFNEVSPSLVPISDKDF